LLPTRLDGLVERAAEIIGQADALIIAAGARIGVTAC
jgi:hypothetical protein